MLGHWYLWEDHNGCWYENPLHRTVVMMIPVEDAYAAYTPEGFDDGWLKGDEDNSVTGRVCATTWAKRGGPHTTILGQTPLPSPRMRQPLLRTMTRVATTPGCGGLDYNEIKPWMMWLLGFEPTVGYSTTTKIRTCRVP